MASLGLQIAIVYDDPPDLIEVHVRASNGRFGGDVLAYERPGALTRLADTLDGFPESSSDAREFILGTFGPGVAGGAVAFAFTCVDRAGHPGVTLTMESGDDRNEPETARFSFRFEAASLDAFVRELRQLRPRSGRVELSAT